MQAHCHSRVGSTPSTQGTLRAARVAMCRAFKASPPSRITSPQASSSMTLPGMEFLRDQSPEAVVERAELLQDHAGPLTLAPSYTDIERQPLNQIVQALFRAKMVWAIGQDVPSKGYQAIIDLTRKLNMQNAKAVQERTVAILASLFPFWLPPAFKIMFSRPFPAFSCRMNAWATALTCQWLMGKCTVNDVEVDGGTVGVGHGVKVERCRYLEATGCASICVNSCKVPTQGLPLTMTPNYKDYSCQFAFGKTPLPVDKDEAFMAPCFTQCPSKRKSSAAKDVKEPQPVVVCHRI